MTMRSYIKKRLSIFGNVEEHFFKEGSEDGVNYILILPGQNPNLEPMLVGAHYDGPIQSPGDDYNTSGVAALFELIKQWKENGTVKK